MNKICELIDRESNRQENEICLIASENYVSKNILQVQGSILTNKYAEGYPTKRYYGGCEVVDEIEQYAIDKAKELFKCNYSNVQPHSGSQANQAVYNALLKPGDTILSMSLDAGGHLTHGSPVSSSGQLYNIVHYGLDENGIIDYTDIEAKLYKHTPKLLIVGASAYSRSIDFERINKIVDYCNGLLYCSLNVFGRDEVETEKEFNSKKCHYMVDMAHIAGLVATGLHPSPIPYADVITSTTHKTLRGPRGGLILTNNEEIAKKINKSVFPGIQGGPLMHVIAAKAVCFEEALQPSFKEYQTKALLNIKAMEDVFTKRKVKMISNGSDNHLILLDLRDKGISGKQLEEELSKIGIVVNKNSIVNDPLPKIETSGIRIGTACITTRGIGSSGSSWLAHQICNIIDILTDEFDYDGASTEWVYNHMKTGVTHLCEDYPIYK